MKEKKAKEYLGRKILVEISIKEENINFKKSFNIIRKFENFKNDFNNEYYTNIELLKDNLILYLCDVKTASGNLATLCNIRKLWSKGKYDYSIFLTKEEIRKMLDDDYLVAVQGLQEISESDLDKLK